MTRKNWVNLLKWSMIIILLAIVITQILNYWQIRKLNNHEHFYFIATAICLIWLLTNENQRAKKAVK